MESLIFAAVIGLTVYLFMRRMRMLKAQKRRQAEIAANGGVEETPQATMPRMGSPGTVTREQLRQLKANDFEPSRLWSKEEAQLILDAVTYLRAAIYAKTGDKEPPLEVQNRLLRFILSDDMLRARIIEWGLNRTHEDTARAVPDLPKDEALARVEAEILREWEAS
jgi:hypothetical protein